MTEAVGAESEQSAGHGEEASSSPRRSRHVRAAVVVAVLLALGATRASLFDIPAPGPDQLKPSPDLPRDRSGSHAFARALGHFQDLTPLYRVIEQYPDSKRLEVDSTVRTLDGLRAALPELREAARAEAIALPVVDSLEARGAQTERLFGAVELLLIESRRSLAEGRHDESLEFLRLQLRITAALARMGGSPWQLNQMVWHKARAGAILSQLAEVGALGVEALEHLIPELVAAQTPDAVFRAAPSRAIAELDERLEEVLENPWQPRNCEAPPSPLIRWNAWHVQPGRTRHEIVRGLTDWRHEDELARIAAELRGSGAGPGPAGLGGRLEQTLTRNVLGLVWLRERRSNLAAGVAWALTGEAMYRMLVMALASRLHVLRGGRPDGLPEALTPSILPALPANPFAPERPLALDRKRLELFSLGADLDGASRLPALSPALGDAASTRPLDPRYDLGVWLPPEADAGAR